MSATNTTKICQAAEKFQEQEAEDVVSKVEAEVKCGKQKTEMKKKENPNSNLKNETEKVLKKDVK